jgi:hypothetical protein
MPGDAVSCARCSQPLEYVGRKRFHEGANRGVFGELGELFVKREHLDVYVCPRCAGWISSSAESANSIGPVDAGRGACTPPLGRYSPTNSPG